MTSLFSVWEGVYDSFEKAGGDTNAFDSTQWIDKQIQRVEQLLSEIENETLASKDYPMPLMAAMLCPFKEKLSVLDFGGGMGLQYLELISSIPNAENKIIYHVVDGKASIKNRPESLNKFKNLHFHEDLDSLKSIVDILHIGSTLQYIDDWRGLLKVLVDKFNPKYAVFSDFMAGDVPSFVTHQVFYEKRIPHRFINLQEFLSFVEQQLHMSLLFKTKFVRSILNQEAVFPNFGLPKTHQIDRPYHMVFSVE